MALPNRLGCEEEGPLLGAIGDAPHLGVDFWGEGREVEEKGVSIGRKDTKRRMRWRKGGLREMGRKAGRRSRVSVSSPAAVVFSSPRD